MRAANDSTSCSGHHHTVGVLRGASRMPEQELAGGVIITSTGPSFFFRYMQTHKYILSFFNHSVAPLYNLPSLPSCGRGNPSNNVYPFVCFYSIVNRYEELMPWAGYHTLSYVFNVYDIAKSERSSSVMAYGVNARQSAFMTEHSHIPALDTR
eukprot:CAMPEP_0185032816 /NCGR_PEP_ID=MMETSP1103-20130426/21268_1 /TAXON_ID=36769 /ORGANISM="Paraphysomonas bandaiensis, Strain Caron Lab Isolate" /LENGTH=152 /DNA_ID=CAMNT_0027568855 /DNA_START=219 /DNA_END=674 /DNA_ORIENTATION=+